MFTRHTNPWAAILLALKLLLIVLVFGVRALAWVLMVVLKLAGLVFTAAASFGRDTSREAFRRALWEEPF